MAVPQWTQNSGYRLATLQERVTTSITLPIAPGSASGTGFDPGTTSISLPAQSRIQNATNIGISKTWTQGGSSVTYDYPCTRCVIKSIATPFRRFIRTGRVQI